MNRINDVKDLAGNVVKNISSTFSFFIPQQGDVVIDEQMSDPSPEAGLPNYEWIELKNDSSFPNQFRRLAHKRFNQYQRAFAGNLLW